MPKLPKNSAESLKEFEATIEKIFTKEAQKLAQNLGRGFEADLKAIIAKNINQVNKQVNDQLIKEIGNLGNDNFGQSESSGKFSNSFGQIIAGIAEAIGKSSRNL